MALAAQSVWTVQSALARLCCTNPTATRSLLLGYLATTRSLHASASSPSAIDWAKALPGPLSQHVKPTSTANPTPAPHALLPCNSCAPQQRLPGTPPPPRPAQPNPGSPHTGTQLRSMCLVSDPPCPLAHLPQHHPHPQQRHGLPQHQHHMHGMVSVMTAAESARDLLASIMAPRSYPELANQLASCHTEELFEALGGLVRSRAQELTGPELANVLWAYATAGQLDAGLMSTLAGCMYERLGDMRPQDLANALWALAWAGVYDVELVSAACEQVWEVLPDATPRQLAAVVQALASFGHHDGDGDLFRSLIKRFRQQLLTHAAPSDAALLVSGLATLRRRDEELLREVCGLVAARVPDMGLHVVSELLWACAVLQYKDKALMDAVAEHLMAVSAAAAPGLLLGVPRVPLPPAPVAAPVPPPALGGPLGTAPPNGHHTHAQQRPDHGATAAAQRAAARGSASASGTGASRTSPRRQRPARPQPPHFTHLHATSLTPSGHHATLALLQAFNPALPDAWHDHTTFTSHSHPAARMASGFAASWLPFTEAHGMTRGSHLVRVPARPSDDQALIDPEVLSKLLWAYCCLHCHHAPLLPALFHHVQRLHFDRISWSQLARLMQSQVKAYELQQNAARVNPLEADSTSAWARQLRTRPVVCLLPDHMLQAGFVALQAEQDAADALADECGAAWPDALGDSTEQVMPGSWCCRSEQEALSRKALLGAVEETLYSMGLEMRPSATIDGMFSLPSTVLINGLYISCEVLDPTSCSRGPDFRPLGPAAARLRSLEWRGWKVLAVPFYEWAALPAEDVAARQAYLRIKLEALIEERLPDLRQGATPGSTRRAAAAGEQHKGKVATPCRG